jgi:NifU-like protein involved in Fe-S cluster formation
MPKDEERLDEAIVYVNIHNYPPRAKCATLSWRALDALLHGEEGEQDEE